MDKTVYRQARPATNFIMITLRDQSHSPPPWRMFRLASAPSPARGGRPGWGPGAHRKPGARCRAARAENNESKWVGADRDKTIDGNETITICQNCSGVTSDGTIEQRPPDPDVTPDGNIGQN